MYRFRQIVSIIIVSTGLSFSKVNSDSARDAQNVDPQRWKLSLNANLLLTLNTYSDNWQGSESGTITWISQLNAAAQKQLLSWLQNQNKLKLAFGETYVRDTTNEEWEEPQKTTDLIDVESRLHFTLGGLVDPFASVRMISQFLDKRDTLDDLYVNPIELTESFGGAVDILDGENTTWTVRAGGALRQRISRGTPAGNTLFTNRGGLDLNTEFETSVFSGLIDFSSFLTVYQAVVRLSEDGETEEGVINEEYWNYPDMNWENTLTVNVAKYVMLNAYVQLLYDRELVSGVRFKQTFSFGLTYKLARGKEKK